MIKQWFGVGQQELDQTTRQPLLALAQHRVAAQKIALLRPDGKAKTGLEDMILVSDVMAEMTEGLLDAAGIHRMQSAELQSDLRARLFQHLEHMGGLIGRDIQLPAQFAHIGHTVGASESHADLDLAGHAEGMGLVREIIGRHQRHQFARTRPHEGQHGLARGHVGDDHAVFALMTAQPGQVALQGRAGDDEEKGGFRQSRHGQVALDPAARVQHLRIDDPARGNVHVVTAEILQERQRVRPLDPDLAEARHVEQAHALTQGHMLGALVVEPVLALPRIAIFALLPLVREPVGSLPARNRAEDRAS